MKRLLRLSGFVVLVTVINVVTLLVVVGPITSGAGGGCPVGPGPEAECNGDVNGDGSLNIADGIYLLEYLFNMGPAPVAIAGGGLTPEQEEILSHMSIEFLDDGQGGTVKTIRFSDPPHATRPLLTALSPSSQSKRAVSGCNGVTNQKMVLSAVNASSATL